MGGDEGAMAATGWIGSKPGTGRFSHVVLSGDDIRTCLLFPGLTRDSCFMRRT
jgi:hypothetical protein